MPNEAILIVDDERAIRGAFSAVLRASGYLVHEAENIAGALQLFREASPDLVLLDVNLPDGLGTEALAEIRRIDPDALVIMATGRVDSETLLASLRGGAHDFLPKPVDAAELRARVRNALETRQLRREVRFYRRERQGTIGFPNLVGDSPAMQLVVALARKVAQSSATSVLLQGESGTGKDVLARAMHFSSPRAPAPFVAINCAAIPAQLLESELFGHERGSFTDAKERKEGLFETAGEGTLFLDEVGELEPALQAKLLRVLEDGQFRRVGGLRDLKLAARVIAASNRDLRAEAEAGRFRLDLYYRLSVVELTLPPLRERGTDVLLIAEAFVARFNESRQPKILGCSPEARQALLAYRWPGNVRELRNAIERAMILEDGTTVTTGYLPAHVTANPAEAAVGRAASASVAGTPAVPPAELPSGLTLAEAEDRLVRRALALAGGNLTHAAKALGISRDQLRYRLKKTDAPPED